MTYSDGTTVATRNRIVKVIAVSCGSKSNDCHGVGGIILIETHSDDVFHTIR